jgi:RNA polymerase sigma factor (sigma-70 family)
MNPSSASERETRTPPAPPVFVTTRWSVVVSAQGKDSPEAARALEQLCRAYWYPLYGHVRWAGHTPADAEDLTQAFFARLLEKDWLGMADRERGRFRSFLLGSLKHFLANEWDKARARERFRLDPMAQGSPDREFDRRWALALLDTVLARLEQDYAQAGKAAAFQHLKSALSGGRADVPYARLSQALGMSEGAVRVAVHRLRQRYREVLREEIAQTVATATEVEDELRQLFAALAG